MRILSSRLGNPTLSIFFMLLLWSAVFGLRQAGNSDLFWQLKTGELIAQTFQIPATDPFTYTAQGNPWFNHEWLACLVFYFVYAWGGFEALSLLHFGLVFLIAFFLFRLFFHATKLSWMGCAFTLLCLYVAGSRIELLRPHLFGDLFFVIYLNWFLVSERVPPLKFASLLFFQLLWTNLHASSFLGLWIVFAWFVQTTLTHLYTKNSIPRALLLAFCFLVISLVNPYGYRLFSFTLEHLQSRATIDYVTDWAPLFALEQLPFFAFWIFLFFVLAALWVVWKKRSSLKWALLVITSLFTFLAIRHQRFIFYGITSLLLFIVCHVDIKALKKHCGFISARKKIIFFFLIFIPIMWMKTGWLQGIKFTWPPLNFKLIVGYPTRIGPFTTLFPKEALDYLGAHPPEGRIFNDMEIGGYLIFRLWPAYQVFVDTRTPIYGESFLLDYVHGPHNPQAMQEVFDRLQINTLVLSKSFLSDYPVLNQWLDQSQTWGKKFDSVQAAIYQRTPN